MRDLKFHKPLANGELSSSTFILVPKLIHTFLDHHAESVKLDCTLLILAGLGVYVYGMFSILGSVFAVQDNLPGS